MKAFYLVLILAILAGCVKEVKTFAPVTPISFNLKTRLTAPYPRNPDGYYLVPLSAVTAYNRFSIYVEGTRVNDPKYHYNNAPIIEAKFDCSAYWVLTDSLLVNIPLYSPFSSLFTSPYFNIPISVRDTSIILSQFVGQTVPIVPPTGIYLKDYDPRMDEYRPREGYMWSKRIIGPIPSYFRGDTITTYVKTSWELGRYSLNYPDSTNKIDSLKIIFR